MAAVNSLLIDVDTALLSIYLLVWATTCVVVDIRTHGSKYITKLLSSEET